MSEAHSAEEVQKHVRTYMYIFGTLLVMTVVTVAVSYLHLSIIPALAVALVVAIFKGTLVARYFMHLSGEKPIIFQFLILTAAFLVFMFILFIWALSDQQGVASYVS
jgi:cytochrome c oxidase subunit IV